MGFVTQQVMQCLLWVGVSFLLGYPPSPPFVIRVWALCGSSCPALMMPFPGKVLTCCSFTELCHFVAVAHPLAQEFTLPPELSVSMFRDPELRQLAQALPYILVHDRAVSTVSTYLGAYKSWKAWALPHNVSVLPADSLTFALYVVSLIQEARSMSTVNSAVYGVNYAHKKSGYPEVSEYPVVKQLLDAAKRILDRPPTRMKPLSIDQVRYLLTHLEGGTIADLQLAALLALGFFGFLRWDDLHHLSVDSLNFGVSHVAIFLTRRMTSFVRAHGCLLPVAVPLPAQLRLLRSFCGSVVIARDLSYFVACRAPSGVSAYGISPCPMVVPKSCSGGA